MIGAVQKDSALLQDIRQARQDAGCFQLWWLGQSGFLVHYNGSYFLFDPYLSDSLTKKYDGTAKPHVRISERVIDPALLDMISCVTSSHNHTDHLDAETLLPISAANPGCILLLSEANLEFAKARLLGASFTYAGLNETTPWSNPPWTVHGITAAHNEIVWNELGQSAYLGFVLKFGPFSIYHSGDTLWHDDLVPQLGHHRVDVALVPINGNDPARGVAGNLNVHEAACLSKAIGARLAVPHHFQMFAFNSADPADFVAACESVHQPHRVLGLGEKLEVTA